jgi:hypothetical protein
VLLAQDRREQETDQRTVAAKTEKKNIGNQKSLAAQENESNYRNLIPKTNIQHTGHEK